MAKRINVVLQDETAKAVARAAKPGERSRFIDQAIQFYASTHGAEAIRARLKSAALRDRDLNEAIARDWFAVDREAWQTVERAEREGRRSTRNAEKSIS